MSAYESVSKVKKTYWVSDHLPFKMATVICLTGLYQDKRQQSLTDLKRLYFTSILLLDASHFTVSKGQPFLSLPKNTSKETKQIKIMNFAYLTTEMVKHYPVLFVINHLNIFHNKISFLHLSSAN